MNESRDGHGVAWIVWHKVGTDVLKEGRRNVLVAWNEVLS
jgi:hypothetical protein